MKKVYILLLITMIAFSVLSIKYIDRVVWGSKLLILYSISDPHMKIQYMLRTAENGIKSVQETQSPNSFHLLSRYVNLDTLALTELSKLKPAYNDPIYSVISNSLVQQRQHLSTISHDVSNANSLYTTLNTFLSNDVLTLKKIRYENALSGVSGITN